MKPLRIAVLDTGINPSHRHVGPVAGGVRISWSEGRARLTGGRPADWTDEIGHGTAVAATISDGLPRDGFELLSVRVFGRRTDAPPQCLAAGIRWAVDQGAGMINLSAGVPVGSDPEGEEALEASWREAGQAGLTLVAPRSRDGTLLVPGVLSQSPGSLVVEADAGFDYGQLGRRGEVLIAPPWARPLPPLPREKNFSGVSLAVAAVTNHAVRLLVSGGVKPGTGLAAALRAAAGPAQAGKTLQLPEQR